MFGSIVFHPYLTPSVPTAAGKDHAKTDDDVLVVVQVEMHIVHDAVEWWKLLMHISIAFGMVQMYATGNRTTWEKNWTPNQESSTLQAWS